MFPLIVNCKYVIRQGAGRVFSNDIWQCTLRKYSMQGNKPESHFVQRVNSNEGCWYHSQQDHDPQFNAEQSNQTARRHSPPFVCSPQRYSKMPCNKPESRFVQRVNSHEGCWYHSRQDHDPQFNA